MLLSSLSLAIYGFWAAGVDTPDNDDYGVGSIGDTGNWRRTFEITYVLRENNHIVVEQLEWEVITPINPNITGYVFAGWYYDQAFVNPLLTIYMPRRDLRVYARWIPFVNNMINIYITQPSGPLTHTTSGEDIINALDAWRPGGGITMASIDMYLSFRYGTQLPSITQVVTINGTLTAGFIGNFYVEDIISIHIWLMFNI
jgi:uncharacterized repeat protein (TIGR02543 family)